GGAVRHMNGPTLGGKATGVIQRHWCPATEYQDPHFCPPPQIRRCLLSPRSRSGGSFVTVNRAGAAPRRAASAVTAPRSLSSASGCTIGLTAKLQCPGESSCSR